jgi:lipoate-protein ligase A
MRLYSLGEIDWKDTQLIYHAMAHLGHEGVVICRPRGPYFCVGFHQDVGQELDLERLKALGEPYFRRETGGGAVRLDRGQVFYQIVVRRDDPGCPPNPERFYERYLQPAMDALVKLGLGAIVAEPNDILVNGKKVSGNGGGDVGDCKVLVGDILVDFDVAKMCQGLRCPTESFRSACLRNMQENMTTVDIERPGTTVEDVERALRKAYLKVCGDGENMTMPSEVLSLAQELGTKLLSKDWLTFSGPVRPWRRVKVREGVHVAALSVEEKGSVHGYLLLELHDGKLGSSVIPPTKVQEPDRAVQETVRVLKAGLARDGPLMKDLRRILQEMDIPKDRMDGLIKDLRNTIAIL